MAGHLARCFGLSTLRVSLGGRSEGIRGGVCPSVEGSQVSDGRGQDRFGCSWKPDELAYDLGHAGLAERVEQGQSNAKTLSRLSPDD